MSDMEKDLSEEAGTGYPGTGSPDLEELSATRPATGSASAGAGKSPEQIRQEIQATKERISDSVEALAEKKAEVEYVKAHPKEVLKERATDLKDEIVSRVSQKKQELSDKAADTFPGSGGGVPSSSSGGAAEIAGKAVKSVMQGVESLEAKLDEKLGVSDSDVDPAGPEASRPR